MKDVLDFKQVPCDLWPLGTKEAGKGTLLTIFPPGKVVLTFANLKRDPEV